MQAMQFSLDDVQQARLAPIVDFKGRKAPGAAVLPQTDAND
jgi:ribosome maturation factor RimP